MVLSWIRGIARKTHWRKRRSDLLCEPKLWQPTIASDGRWTLPPIQHSLELSACLGAIQNRDNMHWVAFKWHEDTIYELDSMKPTPTPMIANDFEAMLCVHLTYPVRAL